MATDINTDEDWLSAADVRHFDNTAKIVYEYQPDLIINLAALTSLEYCERNPEDSWNTNALGAENMARMARELNIPNVYICTAGIFDGEKDFYTEDDVPRPISEYGKAKYEGEKLVQSTHAKYYIFRAGWMIHPRLHNNPP